MSAPRRSRVACRSADGGRERAALDTRQQDFEPREVPAEVERLELATGVADEPADVVTRLLASRNSAVLVKSDGAVRGILTRFDMLQFIVGGES